MLLCGDGLVGIVQLLWRQSLLACELFGIEVPGGEEVQQPGNVTGISIDVLCLSFSAEALSLPDAPDDCGKLAAIC